MKLESINQRYLHASKEEKISAIFANLFVIQNRLQTVFDQNDSEITIKQFLLLIMLKQSNEVLSFTQLGELMGCSRQNVKKLALVLEKKGFVSIKKNQEDIRSSYIQVNGIVDTYFEQASSYHEDILTILFEDFTSEEISFLFSSALKLHKGLERIDEYHEQKK